ncbi:hypothetical protein [Flavobacterium nakdongensis]
MKNGFTGNKKQQFIC